MDSVLMYVDARPKPYLDEAPIPPHQRLLERPIIAVIRELIAYSTMQLL